MLRIRFSLSVLQKWKERKSEWTLWSGQKNAWPKSWGNNRKKSKLRDIHQQGAGKYLTATSPEGDNQKFLSRAFPWYKESHDGHCNMTPTCPQSAWKLSNRLSWSSMSQLRHITRCRNIDSSQQCRSSVMKVKEILGNVPAQRKLKSDNN